MRIQNTQIIKAPAPALSMKSSPVARKACESGDRAVNFDRPARVQAIGLSRAVESRDAKEPPTMPDRVMPFHAPACPI